MNSEAFLKWSFYKKKESEIISIFKNTHKREWENNIGNDCAIMKTLNNSHLLFTKDLFIENVHFFSNMPPESLAYKLLTVNISDICSDGGIPKYFLLGVALPETKIEPVKHIAEHLVKLSDEWGIPIIGGDTTRSETLSFSVTCIGEMHKTPWLRKNAQQGDYIYLTGDIGLSMLGLKTLQKNNQQFDWNNKAIYKHCFPPQYTHFISYLQSSHTNIHAGVDISDGFLEDLTQILLESQVSCLLDEEAIPVHSYISRSEAYFSGEEYELILTAPKPLNTEEIFNNTNVKLTQIGKITKPIEKLGEIWNMSCEKMTKIYKKEMGEEYFFHF